MKEVIGTVDNVCILEREAFSVLFSDLKDQVTVIKTVRLNMKDYKKETCVNLVKVKVNDMELLIVSEMLTY